MTTLRVGPNFQYASIAAAMLDAGNNDSIWLEPGYKNENALVTKTGMIVTGGASSTGIVLRLATGIPTFTLQGTAPITLRDAIDGNGIVGNAGDNVIYVRDGSDAVSGGLGDDRLVIDYRDAIGAVTGDSTSQISEAGGSRLVSITNGSFEHFKIYTGSGADTLTTGAGDDHIDTGAGASTVTVGQGRNYVRGGSGADTVTGLDGGNTVHAGSGANIVTTGGGSDVITTGIGSDTIVAGGGSDRVYVLGGADTVDAGAGTDRITIDYSAMTTAVTGGVTGGNLGGGYTGEIADSAGSVVDFTGVENFTVKTGSANDVITSGAGTDDLTGAAGNDRLFGGGGDDVLNGNTGADHLNGGTGSDRIYSGSDDDVLQGKEGSDRLLGNSGNDGLYGGEGDDDLFGGAGRDVLHGGDGADAFSFRAFAHSLVGRDGRDVISDFVRGTDIVELTDIDANTLLSGNQAFTFIGVAEYHGVAGELRYVAGIAAGDVNGDGRSDFQIGFADHPALAASDFLL